MKPTRRTPCNSGFEPLEPRVHLSYSSADFNGDGNDDLIWHNEETGANAVWFMERAHKIGAAAVQSVRDTDWFIAEVGDFNRDGKGDLLWRHKVTGTLGIWLMDGTAMASSAWLARGSDAKWECRGVGDMDRDGDTDILWWNSTNHNLVYWRMNGVGREGAVRLPFQHDGPDGLGDAHPNALDPGLFSARGLSNGWGFWIDYMENGRRGLRWGDFSPGPNNEGFFGVAVRDLNGNGRTDIVLRNPVTGENVYAMLTWYDVSYWRMEPLNAAWQTHARWHL